MVVVGEWQYDQVCATTYTTLENYRGVLYVDTTQFPQWSDYNCVIVVFLWKSSTSEQLWVDTTLVQSNVYSFNVDSLNSWDILLVVRMAEGSTAPYSWENRWNQTSEISTSSFTSGNYNTIYITGWENSNYVLGTR